MANIKTYLDAIMEAEYGEQVRGSIHDAIKKINDDVEELEESGSGIKELTDGTPTNIEGVLEGKNGKLQKMTIPPPIYTGYWSKTNGNYKKFMEFTFDASQQRYPRFEMAFIFSHSMGGFPYTPRYYIAITPGNTFTILYNSYISSWGHGILGVTYPMGSNIYKCELWWAPMSPLPDSTNTYYITELMAPPWLKFNFLSDGEEKTTYEWNSEYSIGKNIYSPNPINIQAYSANQLSSSRQLRLNGDIIGSTNVTFSSSETINTSINWSSIGEIPIENIPKGAIEKPNYVENEAEMLTLTIEDVQNGDTVICTDHDPANMYLVVREDLLGTMEAFIQYKGGAATSIDWKNVHDAPTSFPANGGNSDTVGGKTIEELQDYGNLNNTPDISKEISNYINAHTNGEYIQETLKMPVSVGDDGKLYVEMPEWVAAYLSADPSWTIIKQYRASETAINQNNYWKLLERVRAIEKQLGLTVNWDSLSPAYVATKTANLLPTEENRLDVLIDDIEDGIVIKEETKNE